MAKRKSIVRQAQEALEAKAAFGVKKGEARAANGGKIPDLIFSYKTMDQYIRVATTFASWARDTHGCRYLDDAKDYVGEYLRERIADKSAWTVAQDAAGIAKMYGCRSTDFGVDLPKRHRADVVKYRNPEGDIGHWQPANHSDLVELCKVTGLRRHELQALRSDQIREENGKVLIEVKGKGGKVRTVEALSDFPIRLAERRQAEMSHLPTSALTPADRDRGPLLIEHIPKRAQIHAYRREYGLALYQREARPLDELSQSEKYICRGELAGMVFDRAAMQTVTGNLGHNRIEVTIRYLT